MFLGSLSKRLGTFGKRSVAIAAAVAVGQLFQPQKAHAIADPSSLYASCYPSTFGSGYSPYCYAQWDASPYGLSDQMYFYFGVNSTSVGTWLVCDQSGSSFPPHVAAADAGSDSFFPRNSSGACPTYTDNANYEMGFQAYGDNGPSNVTWCGVVQNT